MTRTLKLLGIAGSTPFIPGIIGIWKLVTFTVFWSGLIVSLIFHRCYFIENSKKQLSTAN